MDHEILEDRLVDVDEDCCEICEAIEGGFIDSDGQWHHDIHCPHHPINKINESYKNKR